MVGGSSPSFKRPEFGTDNEAVVALSKSTQIDAPTRPRSRGGGTPVRAKGSGLILVVADSPSMLRAHLRILVADSQLGVVTVYPAGLY